MFLRGSDNAKITFDSKNPKSQSRTHQSFAKDADINNIMQRFQKTGVLVDPTLMSSERQPRFGDFSDIADYSQIVGRINEANEAFMTLSAEVRFRFNNDVEECLQFIADPKNLEEAVKLKLLPETALPVKTFEPVDFNKTAPAQPGPTA